MFLALIIWEHIITLDEELTYIWKHEYSSTNALIIVNRYVAVAYGIMSATAGLTSDLKVSHFMS